MGKKTKRVPPNKPEKDLHRQEDKLITDLIERRKLQQDALTKIIVSLDEANEQSSSAAPLKKKTLKNLSK